MNETRTVIDTGVAVSAVLLPRSVPRQAFDVAAARGKLLVSEATVAELDEVLRRPKFNKYVPEEKRLEFLAALVREAEQVEVTEVITACRDAKDNKFLELAVSGRASHLLSGDGDLLALHPFRAIAVVTPQAFLASLVGGGVEPGPTADRPRA
jgi:putative PIN family toxin of toxin-antitoxin system